jgi:fucose 4-O-acetylase-like acetyltransferase
LLLAAAFFAGSLGYGLNLPANGYVNVAEAAYGNPFPFLAVGASGTLCAVCLSVFLEAVTEGGRAWTLRWLEILGTNTLGILCIHRFFLRLLRPWTASLDLPSPVPTLLRAASALLLSALLSLVLSRVFPPAVGLPFHRRETTERRSIR